MAPAQNKKFYAYAHIDDLRNINLFLALPRNISPYIELYSWPAPRLLWGDLGNINPFLALSRNISPYIELTARPTPAPIYKGRRVQYGESG